MITANAHTMVLRSTRSILLVLCALSLFWGASTIVRAHTVDAPGEHTIHMDADGFSPQKLEIKQGDTVHFENVDDRDRWPASNIHPTHTVYPGSDIAKCGTDEAAGIFDACRGIAPGEIYSFTFNIAGRWRLHDHLWPQLTGEIVVAAVDGFVADEVTVTSSQTTTKEHVSVAERIDEWIKSLAQGLANILARLFSLDSPFDGGNSSDVLPEVADDIKEVSVVSIAEDRAVLAAVIQKFGPEQVMTRLLEETGGGNTVDCHQEAHQVGRVSFELFGAEVFEKGDASCHSGYYHGGMESFLSQHGTENLAEEIEELCSIFDTTFGVFECLHGVGHGVMAYENYDLLASLEGCEELADDFSTRSCYGGVFMENVVAGQGLGAIPGHETEWVSDVDMQFPCNAIGDDWGRRYECYQMQTSWMLTLTGGNFTPVINACNDAPEDMVEVCYKSIGRDAAGNTLRNPEKILAICGEVPETGNYYNRCIEGAVNVIIDFWGPKLENQAYDFCAQVPKEDSRERCSSIVDGRIPFLFGAKS